ncbi:uncharacterized protein At3g17950 [Impatiens glandulifera]|uniref:uncharacterized protein At3g17950 n=1 Tax=Impatiens glandulifera TaxID=253017 RepID=UPI001FB085B4|nr:uncharacterized protein At3g17950 [Impatiens glandulifera]
MDIVVQQQEEGWPLGLQPVNQRVGFGRVLNHDRHGSISFSTLLTASPSSISHASSSDLDTESSGSFFHERSVTLGRLIGISSLLELSRRSIRARQSENPMNDKRNCRTRSWFFSLCSKVSTDAASMNINPTPSLGYFLQAERRAADIYRGNSPPRVVNYVAANTSTTLDALFLEDHVAPNS